MGQDKWVTSNLKITGSKRHPCFRIKDPGEDKRDNRILQTKTKH